MSETLSAPGQNPADGRKPEPLHRLAIRDATSSAEPARLPNAGHAARWRVFANFILGRASLDDGLGRWIVLACGDVPGSRVPAPSSGADGSGRISAPPRTMF